MSGLVKVGEGNKPSQIGLAQLPGCGVGASAAIADGVGARSDETNLTKPLPFGVRIPHGFQKVNRTKVVPCRGEKLETLHPTTVQNRKPRGLLLPLFCTIIRETDRRSLRIL
jgi:hypothetical protein